MPFFATGICLPYAGRNGRLDSTTSAASGQTFRSGKGATGVATIPRDHIRCGPPAVIASSAGLHEKSLPFFHAAGTTAGNHVVSVRARLAFERERRDCRARERHGLAMTKEGKRRGLAIAIGGGWPRLPMTVGAACRRQSRRKCEVRRSKDEVTATAGRHTADRRQSRRKCEVRRSKDEVTATAGRHTAGRRQSRRTSGFSRSTRSLRTRCRPRTIIMAALWAGDPPFGLRCTGPAEVRRTKGEGRSNGERQNGARQRPTTAGTACPPVVWRAPAVEPGTTLPFSVFSVLSVARPPFVVQPG